MTRNLVLLICALFSFNAHAQTAKKAAIRIGTIEAAQQCTFYQGIRYNSKTTSSGSSSGYAAGSGSGYANAYGGGGSASFSAGSRSSYSASNTTSLETYFVKDCVSHFEGIRAAMQSALASTSSTIIAPGGYMLSGRVENVVPISNGFAERGDNGQSYGTVSEGLKVTMSINIADKAGRIVFGAPITAEIETASVSAVRGTVSASAATGEGLYSLLQRQVAMIAARKVAFHFNPLTVIQGGGKSIQLNYGAPLLEVGSVDCR